MKIILTLCNGQASAERSFSVNNTVINVNMSQDSIVAKKIVKYHMISNKLTPESVQITKNYFVLLALHNKYMEIN